MGPEDEKKTSVSPDKNLGQNFLTDKFHLNKIVRAVGATAQDTVLEIGPGTGALTRPLLESGATVIALEIDPRCAAPLDALKEEYPDTFTYHITDAMDASYTRYAPKGSILAGNLPYNVGTQIVLKGLEEADYFKRMVFLLQKEVVARICATPSSSDWGRLGVICSLKADCDNLFDVPPGAFFPAPKVTSGVVRLTPLSAPRHSCDEKKLEAITRQAFGQRRKMLRASLKKMFAEEELEKVGIKPTQRPETVSLKQFADLSRLESGC